MAAVASPPTTAGESSPKMPIKDEPPQSERVLTPPTSEDLNKMEDNSSDLSDLEDLDVDIEDVKPDHYWDEENGGKIPVFKPTMEQFRDFGRLIAQIDSYGMQSGIVKVIPPKEWRDSLGSLDEAIKSIRVKNPITQEFAGTHGHYTQANIEKQRSYNLPQWKGLCEESNHKTPARKGDRRKEAAAAKAARPVRAPAATGEKRRPGRPRRGATKDEDVPTESVERDTPDVPPTPTSPGHAAENEDEDDAKEKTKSKRGRPGRKPGPKPAARPSGGRQPKAAKDVKKSVASRRLHNQSEVWDIDEEAFEDFDYHLEGADQFDPERCKELEETYWKTINFGTPMYGADMPGSLFDDSVTSWNVAHLPNLLDVLGTKVPGVNTAYLYLGMWKATFAWHLEDVDLYSINYIHFGAPKQWYSISQADARKFEQAMRSVWPQDYKHCDQFLRHKTYLISPEKLKSQFGIKVNKLVHYEGEFVITYPYGYHSGFNLGYNCAESVNFATEDWLNYGRIAKKCLCEADSVWVDVNEIERKLRGEPTPEYYEVTDDESDEEEEVLPTPPASVKGKTASRKRKRAEEKPKDAGKRKVKRIKLRIRTNTREPCVLCPNDVSYDELLPTSNKKQAHRLCAQYTPETYIRTDPATGKEIVFGIDRIDKARLDLKCNYCRSKKGAVFQCCSKKCTRAFHATCAAPAGVQVDHGQMPTWDEAGVEYFYEGHDFRCRFHRPRRPKNHDGKLGELLENSKLINKHARNLEVGQVVQAQCLEGDIFAGVVLENRPGEETLLITVEPEGIDKVEIEYKYVLALDPAQSQRPKPSPDAIPLPELLENSNQVSTDNRQDGVPSKGDPFMDPEADQIWEEFNSVHSIELKNPFQKHVDFSKPEQLWHYLGKTSTEAKAQYTHDITKTLHNPKSSFLDTVKPPPPKVSITPQRTSYPAYPSYMPGPNGAGVAQRPPLQPRTSSEKPYQYKPKQEVQPNIFKSQLPYTNWHNTSIAQQQTKYSTPARPSYNAFTPGYSPPAMSTSPTTTPPQGLQPYNHSSFYQQAERRYSQQPAFHQVAPAAGHGQARPAAPVANMHNFATSAATQSTGQKSVAKPQTVEYVTHIQRYPYLRNAYARRPEKYSSPYTNNFGFSGEYEMKIQSRLATRPYAPAKIEAKPAPQQDSKTPAMPPYQSAPLYYQPPRPAQSMQYQSPQDFQQHISQEGSRGSPHAGPAWSELLNKLGPAPPAQQQQYSPPARQMMYQHQHTPTHASTHGVPQYGGAPPPVSTYPPTTSAAQVTQPSAAPSTMRPSLPGPPTSHSSLAKNIMPTSLPAPIAMMRKDSGGGSPMKRVRSVDGKPPYDPTKSPIRPDYSPLSEHATPAPASVPPAPLVIDPALGGA